MSEYLNETLQDLDMQKTPGDLTIVACISIALMSCLSIYFGARSSILSVQKNKEKHREAELKSAQDGLKLTLTVICFQVGIYVLLRLVSIKYINFLIKLLFTIDMIIDLKCILMDTYVSKLVPEYHEIFYNTILNISLDEFITYGICSMIVGIYCLIDSWTLSNIFVINSAIQYITDCHLNNVTIACTFIGSLAICDAVEVFATDIMDTIAKSIKIPNVLVFPVDMLYNWKNGNKFMKLGLGHVVVPGCFIALLLRFDESLKRGEKLYFHSGIVAYIVGIVITFAMAVTFKNAQPALLYLVPACIGIPCLVAVIKGDIHALLTYHDY